MNSGEYTPTRTSVHICMWFVKMLTFHLLHASDMPSYIFSSADDLGEPTVASPFQGSCAAAHSY